ncbi:hypothetical protein MOV73_003794 [Raoultella ornithinolytica]|uniref:hypothetical protein n=1 Tax=Klebsiella/Raoultella group TaxID=2890311 RepID=UPI0020CFE5FD|nr:hypothetical protein [Klebsiella pneumoniae]EKT9523081.1 hypothetical protein [Raoultella ornithinolytica]HDU5016188.1 hypothetical protein [Klebsiella quasipneumoniae subsp. quasipneumoniae]HDZ9441262.1 hypothetical protein [Klebsiella quasipneumoniae subsp. similipneumoniae]EKQ7272687.1 hypothetical protein [Klebsiella pneumoniae]EKW7116247.1 hypothetical protein [Raoultella ornithinolytica]
MKSFLNGFISNAISWSLLALLVYAAWTGSEALSRISAVAYWMIIILMVFMSVIVTFAVFLIKREDSPQKKNAAIESLRVVFKRSGVLSKIVGWFRLIAIVMLLAYSGWVFTAVSYALCALFSRFIISVGRDEYEKVTSGLQA